MKAKKIYLYLLIFTSTLIPELLRSQNQSSGAVNTSVSPVAPSPIGITERFRFGAGIITQLENQGATLFDFSGNDQWISFGRLNSSVQTLYGFRAQRAGRGLLIGFTGSVQSGSTPTIGTPFIQWVGNSGIGVLPGDLDFRVATNPTTGVGSSTRVLRLGSGGSSVFGPIDFGTGARLEINSNDKPVGLFVITNPGDFVSTRVGIQTEVESSGAGYGLLAITRECQFNYPVYGGFSDAQSGGFISAGYFAGGVYANGFITLSDKKLKTNIKSEKGQTLALVQKLNPVTYNFSEISRTEIGGSTKLQHGFLAQEVEELFPEVVELAKHPKFENGKLISTTDYKAINYQMLIPILTKAIQELSIKVEQLEAKLNEQNSIVVLSQNLSNEEKNALLDKGYSLNQNKPNPFSENTIIEYRVPENETQSLIVLYDLNGKQVRQFKLAAGVGQIKLSKKDLSSGIYLYSLISNGQEVLTKRLLVQ